jgi:hypothetical protein
MRFVDESSIEEPQFVGRRGPYNGRVAALVAAMFSVGLVSIIMLSISRDTTAVRTPSVPVVNRSATVSPGTVTDCVERHSPMARAGVISVDDRELGPTTISVEQFCEEDLALQPADQNAGLIAQLYVSGGHVQADYYEYTDKVGPDGGIERTPASAPLPSDVAAERLAAIRTKVAVG